MKILNLYAGIGGNRKLWDKKHKVTAVEIVPEIAEAYKRFFPNDNVIVADAHDYLLKHFKEYDFIWSSPPCPTHSVCCYFLKGQGIIRYPDMKLYQEIILLSHFFRGKFVVENVKPYYKPLIEPQVIGRHCFWANFIIPKKEINYVQIGTFNRGASKSVQRKAIIREAQIPELTNLHKLNLIGIRLKNKRQILRNCVLPEIGLHVFKQAWKQNK